MEKLPPDASIYAIIEAINCIVDELSSGKKTRKRTFKPPSFGDFSEYCKANGFGGIAVRAYHGYHEADWHDAQGKQICNWKQKLQNGWFHDNNRDKPNVFSNECNPAFKRYGG